MSKRALKRIPKIIKEVDREEERLAYLLEKADSLPTMSTEERVQSTPKQDSMIIVDAIADLKDRISKKEYRLKQLIDIAGLIISDSNLSADGKDLMRFRYVCGFTWKEVAIIMHYSLRHTLRMHGICLKELFKK